MILKKNTKVELNEPEKGFVSRIYKPQDNDEVSSLLSSVGFKFKSMDEGQLTKKRASLVNRTFLSLIGQKLGLIDCLILRVLF